MYEILAGGLSVPEGMDPQDLVDMMMRAPEMFIIIQVMLAKYAPGMHMEVTFAEWQEITSRLGNTHVHIHRGDDGLTVIAELVDRDPHDTRKN